VNTVQWTVNHNDQCTAENSSPTKRGEHPYEIDAVLQRKYVSGATAKTSNYVSLCDAMALRGKRIEQI